MEQQTLAVLEQKIAEILELPGAEQAGAFAALREEFPDASDLLERWEQELLRVPAPSRRPLLADLARRERDDRHARAKDLFLACAEMPTEERAPFLLDACGDDRELIDEIERMLSFEEEAPGFLERPALEDAIAGKGLAGDLRPGDRVGPYRILEELGEGGMGTVYAVEQRKPVRRTVALKVIKLGMDSKAVVARFEQERQALALMDHEGIAKVFDCGTSERGQPFFAMELVQGVQIDQFCEQQRLPLPDRLRLMQQVCAAVQHAHQKGVVHRDLKPGNVLVSEDGGRRQVKIIDFGLAKAMGSKLVEATLFTEAGQILGTPEYMAPEQADPTNQDIDTRADIYSLGVILYQLLAGELPFPPRELRRAGMIEIQRILREVDPPKPSSRLSEVTDATTRLAHVQRTSVGALRKALRDDLDWVVLKALEKDRNRRYDTTNALSADLQRFLDHEPLAAGPPSASYRLRKLVHRNRGQCIAGTLVFLALLGGGIGTFVQYLRAQTVLDGYSRLEDARHLEEARIAANMLWPTSTHADALVEWLERYAPLTDHLAGHEAAVERLARTDSFADEQRQWQYDKLVQLVEDLRTFAGDDGLLAEVRRRHELAVSIEETTCESRSSDWQAAIERIGRNLAYSGLAITPQVGLIPLGPDPASGLEEFLHLESHGGVVPPPGNGERIPLTVGDDTGLVFVLLPGGSFWMGAHKTADRSEGDMPNADPHVIEGWEKSFRVADLDAFFMSKYEMTEGQWEHFLARNQSVADALNLPVIKSSAPDRPVHQVSFDDCVEVLDRLGLKVPAETQLEYAARAGTKQAFWTGPEPASLAGRENIFNRTSARLVSPWWPLKERIEPGDFEDEQAQSRWQEGNYGAAPVGSYEANAFGLFDVAGNVSEYCWPRRSVPTQCIVRGGNYMYGVNSARSAARQDAPVGFGAPVIGLRPALDIQ